MLSSTASEARTRNIIVIIYLALTSTFLAEIPIQLRYHVGKKKLNQTNSNSSKRSTQKSRYNDYVVWEKNVRKTLGRLASIGCTHFGVIIPSQQDHPGPLQKMTIHLTIHVWCFLVPVRHPDYPSVLGSSGGWSLGRKIVRDAHVRFGVLGYFRGCAVFLPIFGSLLRCLAHEFIAHILTSHVLMLCILCIPADTIPMAVHWIPIFVG